MAMFQLLLQAREGRGYNCMSFPPIDSDGMVSLLTVGYGTGIAMKRVTLEEKLERIGEVLR